MNKLTKQCVYEEINKVDKISLDKAWEYMKFCSICLRKTESEKLAKDIIKILINNRKKIPKTYLEMLSDLEEHIGE